MTLMILSSGCISFLEFKNADDSNDITIINNTYNYYSAYGVSFKCTGNWSVVNFNDSEKATIAACKIQNSSFQPQFMIDIYGDSISGQEGIKKAKKYILPDYKQVWNNVVEIDGNKANDSIFTVNDIVGKGRIELIYFVKNGKTYLITFSSADKDFDKEKPDFDRIIKSFKVQ